MRVLVLTRYARNGASSRLRFMQFFPALREEGIEVVIQSFFDQAYLQRTYRDESTTWSLPRYYAARISALLRSGRFDLIWLEKEALPWLPAWMERAFLSRRTPLVVDYDDAVFHRYDKHRLGLVRGLLGSKIDGIMRASDLVVAGNAYIAQRACDAGASRVEIIPTVVDMNAYQPRESGSQNAAPVIGWIGTPATWKEYLEPRMGMLQSICRDIGARLRIIGVEAQAFDDDHVEFRPWVEATEIDDIRALDIGIMPLSDTPWARGKCGYKLIQYMACGLPVVASPVGVNPEIVEHGVNGFLADSDVEWEEAFQRLVSSAALRERMGRAGRQIAQTKYSYETTAPMLVDLLNEMAGPKPRATT